MKDPSVFVVADAGTVGQEVLACLLTWSSAGWLRPFLWVPVAEDGARAGERLIVHGELQVGDFRGHLGRRTDGFRFVCAQFAPHGEDRSAVRRAAVSMAREVSSASSRAHQPLKRISLIVPSSILAPLPASTLFAGKDAWEVNAIVSPEDRQTDKFADAGVALGQGFAEHAALAVATAAGLWAASSESPFDQARVELSPKGEAMVESVRCFGRILAGPLMVERALQQVVPYLEGAAAWRIPAARFLNGEVVESEGKEIERVRREFLRSPNGVRLRFQPPAPFQDPSRTAIGLFRAVWDFTVFLGRGLLTAPMRAFYRAFDQLAAKAESWAQEMIYGSLEQSAMEVRLGRRRVGMYVQPTAVPAVSEAYEDEDVVLAAEGPLWHDLRLVSFGLVDAGEFPDAVSAPNLGNHRPAVIGDRALVAPPPPFAPDTLGSLLGSALPPERDPEQQVALIDAGTLNDIQAWLKRRIPEPPQEDATIGTKGDVTEALGDGAASADAEPDVLSVALERIDSLISQRESSLLWKIAKLVWEQIQGAKVAADAAAADERASGKELEEMQADYSQKFGEGKGLKRRRRRTRWLTVGILVLLAPVGIYLFARREVTEDLLPNLKGLLAGGVMTSLLWSAVGQFAMFALGARILAWLIEEFRYLRLVYKVSNQQLLVFAKQSYLRTALVHVRGEEVRLKRIYDRLMLWGEAIALVLHRPLGHGHEWLPDGEETEVAPVPRPMALQVAEGRSSDASLRQRSSGMVRNHLTPGWLGDRLSVFADWVRADEARHVGLESRDLPWDLDGSLTGNELRSLVEALRVGSLGNRWWTELRRDVFDDLAKSEPGKLFDSIQEVVSADGRSIVPGGPADAVAFLTEIFPEGTPPQIGGDKKGIWEVEAFANSVAACHSVTIWAPRPMRAPDMSRAQVLLSEPSVTSDGSLLMMSLRMDRTKRQPASALRIVEKTPESTVDTPRPDPDRNSRG